jgi:hypothetical protein
MSDSVLSVMGASVGPGDPVENIQQPREPIRS